MRIPDARKLRTLADRIRVEPPPHVLHGAPERAGDLIESLALAREPLRADEFFQWPGIVVDRVGAREKGRSVIVLPSRQRVVGVLTAAPGSASTSA